MITDVDRTDARGYTYGEAGGESPDCLHDLASCGCEEWVALLLSKNRVMLEALKEIAAHEHKFGGQITISRLGRIARAAIALANKETTQ